MLLLVIVMEFDYKFKETVMEIGDNAKYVLPSSVFIMKNKNSKKESVIRIVTVMGRELRNVMTSYILGYELLISDLMSGEVLVVRNNKKKRNMSNIDVGDSTYKFKSILIDRYDKRIPMHIYYKLYYDLNKTSVSDRVYDIDCLMFTDNKVK